MAIFPSEFDSSNLRLGSRRQFGSNPDDFAVEVLYNEAPLQVETPWLRCVFGQSKYQTNKGRPQYSLSFDMAKDSEVADLHEFVKDFEKLIRDHLEGGMDVQKPFYSCIRPPKDSKFNPTLRLKLKTRRANFDCEWEGSEEPWPTNEERVKHGDRCRLVMQLMPIWSAGDRVGISFKVVRIQKEERSGFRRRQAVVS